MKSMIMAVGAVALTLASAAAVGASSEFETSVSEASAAAADPAPPCAICGPTSRAGKSLSIQGSTTLRPIIDRAATTASIVEGIDVTGRNLGSTTGIRALIEGECERRGTWTSGGPCDLGGDGVVGTGDGPADIGIASRTARAVGEIDVATAQGICVVEHPVAVDGLGIVINNNPACSGSFPLLAGSGLADFLTANLPASAIGPSGGLSERIIKEILFGTYPTTEAGASAIFKQWADLTGDAAASLPNVTIVSRTEEGGTYGAFLDLYVCNNLDGTPTVGACSTPALFPFNTGSSVDPFEWIRPPSSCTPTMCGVNDLPVVNPALGSSPTQFVGSNDEIIDLVASTCGAIGYAGISFIETAIQSGAQIKSFPVTRTLAEPPVAATFNSTLNGSFDFTRKLYAYTVGTPTGSDPRGRFLDLLYTRLGQANVFEAGFVPFNGVLPRNAGALLQDHAQIMLEPVGKDLIKGSATRVATKLALIAEAEAIIAAGGPGSVTNAITDLIESEFSVRETVDENNALFTRLRARTDGCLAAGTCDDPAKAMGEAARADASYAVALSSIVADDPMTAADEFFTSSDFSRYLKDLEKAFSSALKADQACNP